MRKAGVKEETATAPTGAQAPGPSRDDVARPPVVLAPTAPSKLPTCKALAKSDNDHEASAAAPPTPPSTDAAAEAVAIGKDVPCLDADRRHDHPPHGQRH